MYRSRKMESMACEVTVGNRNRKSSLPLCSPCQTWGGKLFDLRLLEKRRILKIIVLRIDEDIYYTRLNRNEARRTV